MTDREREDAFSESGISEQSFRLQPKRGDSAGDPHSIANAFEGQNESEGFYLPKESSFLSLNCESMHVWPVNGVTVNELLRRNQEDHLIHLLRAARKMLDRISALHNTAVLIPIDELKSHIARLQQCVQFCKRTRVTHHCNAIHPLQATFEDLLEQFTFELRVFTGRSITVGHNAKKMIDVSRVLRRRMGIRDRSLALVSPLMRRILIKLLALRLFIQLVKERPRHLIRDKGDDAEEDVFGNVVQQSQQMRHSSNSDDSSDADNIQMVKPLIASDQKRRQSQQHRMSNAYDIFGSPAAASQDPFAPDDAADDPFADRVEEGRDPLQTTPVRM